MSKTDSLSLSPEAGATQQSKTAPAMPPLDTFLRRHNGPGAEEAREMLGTLGFPSLDSLIDGAVPSQIRLQKSLDLPAAKGEHETLAELRAIAAKNQVFRSFIGAGYSDCITPPVIQRNILENPGWYTAYTPYQAEIAQGRLEALLNFQTMMIDLTGMEIANASLLDEATAAAEAMAMCHAIRKDAGAHAFFVSQDCHPQTIDVIRTRAEPLGIKVIVGNESAFRFEEKIFAVLLQYPATHGAIRDHSPFIEKVHAANALAIVAADILSLTLIKPPGEFGADVAVGSTQRFGVPLGFGGPHAAYFATRDEFKRHMPGRLVGVSHDAEGRPAYRLAANARATHPPRQSHEQHLHGPGSPRRDRLDVRRLPRPGGAETDRKACSCDDSDPRIHVARTRLRDRRGAILRHTARIDLGTKRAPPTLRRKRRSFASTSASSTNTRWASRSMKRRTTWAISSVFLGALPKCR